MKKSKFTEEQIAFALKQVESGTTVEEICRKRRSRPGARRLAILSVGEPRRPLQLEEENHNLKQL